MTAQDVAKVAAEAGCDPRSVVRALDGRTKSAVMRRAIAGGLRKFGFKREAAKLEGSAAKP